MSRSKLVEIHFCSECSRKGREEDGTRVCTHGNKHYAFEDQDDLAEIPDWCQLPDAPDTKEENSDNTQQLKAEITSLEKWVTENYKSKNLNIIIEIILTKLRQLAAV